MLPNWLYGKSKSKLAELLGGGGTPSDYNQVKAQVTQNTESIALLNSAVDAKIAWSDYAQLGAVNYCKCTIETTTLNDGTTTFTVTVNDDNSVTISAPSYPVTLATNLFTKFWSDLSADECKPLVGKVLKFSGCPQGGSNSKYKMGLYRVESSDGSGGTVEDYGEGAEFTWRNNGSGTKTYVSIAIISGYVMTGPLTFYPMIAPVSYNGPYVPYAKTNEELTSNIATLDSSINGILNSVILSNCNQASAIFARYNNSTLNSPYTESVTEGTTGLIISSKNSAMGNTYITQIAIPDGIGHIYTRTLATASWTSWALLI